MKFGIIQISDSNFLISSEGYTDLNKARMAFHGLCQALYAEASAGNIKEGFTVLLMNDGGGIVEQENYVDPYVPEVIEDMPEPVAESEE
jgi:hypothetical protein